MIEAGLVTALGFIFVMMRMDIRKVAGYAIVADLSVTFGLMWLFQGTYAGMMTGIFAGTIISIFLTVVRRTIGYKTMSLVRYKGDLWPRVKWESHGPTKKRKVEEPYHHVA